MELIDEKEMFRCYEIMEMRRKSSTGASMQRRNTLMVGRRRGEMFLFGEIFRK